MTGAWEAPFDPLTICTPHQGKMTAEWHQMFGNLQKPPICLIINSAKLPVDCARDKMVYDARKISEQNGHEGFPDIFFLDSDVLINTPDLLQLLSYDRYKYPIVSGLYWAKKGERCPAAWVLVKKEHDIESRYAPALVPDYGVVPNGSLMEVHVVGAGCLLIRGEVFDKVPPPWFYFGTGRTQSIEVEDLGNGVKDVQTSEDYFPPYISESIKTPYGYIYGTDHKESEDFFFNLKCRDHGYKIWLDPNIRCQHECKAKMDADGYPMIGAD